MTEALPAHDLAAEQALLGAALAAPDIAGPALLTVPSQAWWSNRNQGIAAAIAGRIRNEQAVDAALVLPAVMAQRTAGDDIGPYLITLMERAWAPGNAMFHADRIRACAATRDLAAACTRTLQRLDGLVASGDELDLMPLVSDLHTRADDAVKASGLITSVATHTVLDLLAEEDTFDWLVPGLLERMERIVITGAEGTGKSEMLAQWSTCLAGGLHPWQATPLHHRFRVLVVDCENPRRLARRRYRRMVPLVEQIRSGMRDEAPSWGEHLFIEFRPDGLNLLQGRDVAWLENVVAATSPDLLVIGPVYKLHASKPEDEQAARELTVVLDGIRTRHECALLMEAHMGHAEDGKGRRRVRPIGSSLMLRWPEFGYGFLRAEDCPPSEHPSLVDVLAWRGSREERHWPRKLRHGHAHRGELPWTPAESDAHLASVS